MSTLLRRFGDAEAESEATEISGVLVGNTKLDPFYVVEKCRELVAAEPWEFRYILRILPVESVVFADTEDIRSAAVRLAAEKIRREDTFKVTVEKRHSSVIRSFDVITAIAEMIENKVDLKNPSWIILVEILGKVAGVSVIKPNQIFSSSIEKRRGWTTNA